MKWNRMDSSNIILLHVTFNNPNNTIQYHSTSWVRQLTTQLFIHIYDISLSVKSKQLDKSCEIQKPELRAISTIDYYK